MSAFDTAFKKYFELFKGQEGYFKADISNLEFFKNNPRNDTREDIRLKVSAINEKALMDLAGAEEMVEHIYALHIDSRLAANDLRLVEDIATLKIRGKQEHLLHFASQYCNYHKPDVFPIYSEQFLELYRHYIDAHKLNVKPDDLEKYPVFKSVLDDVLTRYGMKEKLNYIEARKFAWLYFEKVLQESAAV